MKGPLEIDLTVDSTPSKIEDKQEISEIIAYFKATGKKTIFSKLGNIERRTQMMDIIF